MSYDIKDFNYNDKEQVYQLYNFICRHSPEKLRHKKYKKLIDSYQYFLMIEKENDESEKKRIKVT